MEQDAHIEHIGNLDSDMTYSMVRSLDHPEWQYKTLAIDVQGRECQQLKDTISPMAHCTTGHPRLYLENADASQGKEKPGFKLLGVQWR